MQLNLLVLEVFSLRIPRPAQALMIKGAVKSGEVLDTVLDFSKDTFTAMPMLHF